MGSFVHTIGGLNADAMTGDFNGAYWDLSGMTSTVGIVVMSDGDVISRSISTW